MLICFISFDQFKDEIISGIEKRVAAWTFLPEGTLRNLIYLSAISGLESIL